MRGWLVIPFAAALAAFPVPAARAGAAPAAAPAPARADVAPPRSPEDRALLAIDEDGHRQVEALAKSAQGMPECAARRAIMSRVAEVKRQTRIRLLEARAGFARARGDLAAARECERALERLLHPNPAGAIGTAPPGREKAQADGGPRR